MRRLAWTGCQDSRDPRLGDRCDSEGFTLIETLIAMLVLTFGLLAAGQMIYVSVRAETLSRSKGNAAIVAQGKIEDLIDLYSRDPNNDAFIIGSHGPEQVRIINRDANYVLNQFNVTWTVSTLSDPRPGKVLSAKQVLVTVTPITTGGSSNFRASLNKVVVLSAILSMRTT